MYELKKITSLNGFDSNDLNNARQNNYAWSICELENYIYVGTGKNIPYSLIKKIAPNSKIPFLINPGHPINPCAEIWRYKKDGTQNWERVFRAEANSKLVGFCCMIQDMRNATPCIYAIASGDNAPMQILKSVNGVNWFFVQENQLPGSAAHSMLRHGDYLYIAPVNAFGNKQFPILYRSRDPEFYDWQPVLNPIENKFDFHANPHSEITNMISFNEKLYAATKNSDGVEIWRTNSYEPEKNDWVLVADKGFGDAMNQSSSSLEEFNGSLYVSTVKELPFVWAVPLGCDVIRIDRMDHWELVVGGRALFPAATSKGKRMQSLSGLGSGFNNPFNVYAWQIKEFNHQMIVSTFDDSKNMELIFELLLANKKDLEGLIGLSHTETILSMYQKIVRILKEVQYSMGFDFYVSDDGIHFKWVTLRGLCNPNNYGASALYVDSFNDLYLGTANPFQGCEVFKADSTTYFEGCAVEKLRYEYLSQIEEELERNWDVLSESLLFLFNHQGLFVKEGRKNKF